MGPPSSGRSGLDARGPAMNSFANSAQMDGAAHDTAQASAAPIREAHASRSQPLMKDKVRLAVLLFLVSEGIFFIFLIVAYIYSQPSEIKRTHRPAPALYPGRPASTPFFSCSAAARSILRRDRWKESQSVSLSGCPDHSAWRHLPVRRDARIPRACSRKTSRSAGICLGAPTSR